MKARKKVKAKTRSKPKTHKTTRSKAHSRHKPESSLSGAELSTSPKLTLNTSARTCQELEVGDIGGFGSPEELEEHQKRCSEPATEFCGNCGRNLCRNHYEMLHRDHDRMSEHSTGASLAY